MLQKVTIVMNTATVRKNTKREKSQVKKKPNGRLKAHVAIASRNYEPMGTTEENEIVIPVRTTKQVTAALILAYIIQ